MLKMASITRSLLTGLQTNRSLLTGGNYSQALDRRKLALVSMVAETHVQKPDRDSALEMQVSKKKLTRASQQSVAKGGSAA